MAGPNPELTVQAKAYILEHPTESKREQARALGCSETHIARCRRALVAEGLLKKPRKAPPKIAAQPAAPLAGDASPKKSREMLDHQAMERLTAHVDTLLGNDEEVQRRLLRQCLTFALDPSLHPDTRMSASKMYQTIKEQQREVLLGPGIPKTRDAAIKRLSDLMRACGAEYTLAAVDLTFTVKEGPSGETGEAPAPV